MPPKIYSAELNGRYNNLLSFLIESYFPSRGMELKGVGRSGKKMILLVYSPIHKTNVEMIVRGNNLQMGNSGLEKSIRGVLVFADFCGYVNSELKGESRLIL